ncbi:hypothetical protein H0H92_014932 [Tricholoma furcatifolium]|nr:hypothetical protein H0H92_014932 [Tricholoma furcatifolium]
MLRAVALILFFFFGFVSANFDFFSNMFGQQQYQQQQPRAGASQWAAQVENLSLPNDTGLRFTTRRLPLS